MTDVGTTMPKKQGREFIQLTRAWYAERELKDARFVEEFCLSGEGGELLLRFYDVSGIYPPESRPQPLVLEIVTHFDCVDSLKDFRDLLDRLYELRRERGHKAPQPEEVREILLRRGIGDATPTQSADLQRRKEEALRDLDFKNPAG
jgi:hypothetical protein